MKRTYTIFTNEDERIITAPSLGEAICRAYRDHSTCKVAEKGSVPVARLWAPETPSEGRPYIVARLDLIKKHLILMNTLSSCCDLKSLKQ